MELKPCPFCGAKIERRLSHLQFRAPKDNDHPEDIITYRGIKVVPVKVFMLDHPRSRCLLSGMSREDNDDNVTLWDRRVT